MTLTLDVKNIDNGKTNVLLNNKHIHEQVSPVKQKEKIRQLKQ